MVQMFAIIGGSGYLGGNLSRSIMESDDVCIIDRTEPDFVLTENSSFVRADVVDQDISDILSCCDAVVHLAAEPDVRRSETAHRDTYLSTEAVVRSMDSTSVRRIVFASSSAVYGRDGWMADESRPRVPVSEYGRAKRDSENFLTDTEGLDAVILRFCNICGREVTHGVVSDFVRRLESDSRRLDILGNGLQMREYLHVDDAVAAVKFVLRSGITGIYNVGNGDPISVLDVADIVKESMGLSDILVSVGDSDVGWNGDVSRCLLDSTRFRDMGWNPYHGSSDAVKDSVHTLLDILRGCNNGQ